MSPIAAIPFEAVLQQRHHSQEEASELAISS
jgi:hypothetical protein